VFGFDFRYLEQLLVALVLASATVFIHGLGMQWVRGYFNRSQALAEAQRRSDSHLMTMVGIVGIMLVTHSAEIFIWALFYRLRGLITQWVSAVYFSIASYTTLGESSITLPAHWQGLGGFEAMTAMLMFGWSIAMLATILLKLQILDT
jgi:voltage-gated potassium channel